MGVVTQLLSLRKGRMETMVNQGQTGWCRMEWLVPARGVDRLSDRVPDRDTRHRAAAPRVRGVRALARRPAHPAQRGHGRGSPGPTTTYALTNLQERGAMFVGPGVEVYEGMIVGENARADDMDVNPTKEKKLTNMRAAAVRRDRSAGTVAAAVARAGPGVHPRGRMRRGHPHGRSTAQGRSSTPPPELGRGPPSGRLASDQSDQRTAGRTGNDKVECSVTFRQHGGAIPLAQTWAIFSTATPRRMRSG